MRKKKMKKEIRFDIEAKFQLYDDGKIQNDSRISRIQHMLYISFFVYYKD